MRTTVTNQADFHAPPPLELQVAHYSFGRLLRHPREARFVVSFRHRTDKIPYITSFHTKLRSAQMEEISSLLKANIFITQGSLILH